MTLEIAVVLSHLADLEPKYTSFILNCPPNRNGLLDADIVHRLAEVGAAWSPDTSRPPLPAQPLRAEYPVNAIDGLSDVRYETCWSTWNLPLPQSITIDLGGVWSNVSTLEYLPKQWNRTDATDGDITSYTVHTSTDGATYTQVTAGSWAGDRTQARRVACQERGLRSDPGHRGHWRIRQHQRREDRRPDGQACAGVHHDGTNVAQWRWLNQANQKWTFTGTGDGYCTIKGVASGRLVEVAGLSRTEGGTVDGADIEQQPYAPRARQQWQITPPCPSPRSLR